MDRSQKQFAVAGLGLVIICSIGAIVFGVLAPKQQAMALTGASDRELDVSIVEDRNSSVSPEMTWITQSRAEITALSGTVETLSKTIEAERAAAAKQRAADREEIEDLFLQLAQKQAELQENTVSSALPTETFQAPDYAATGSEFIERRSGSSKGRTDLQVDAPLPPKPFGSEFELTASKESSSRSVNNLDNYIPAGSYARAVVISGADAPTNVQDRENPVPVLLRLTGPAITAANGKGRGARVDVTGCTVQGSAVGDLSSERVKVRLVSLTCLSRNGTILEQKVSGYVAGSGKQGVRGHVVSREGSLVGAAAFAGALEGLGGALSSAGDVDDESLAASGVMEAAAAASMGQGVSNAASSLSEYYINRAEQYQPVVTMNAGTTVEVVFLEGVSLK